MKRPSPLGALAGGSNPGDDRAVSPVIGVILMVAITVILAAVIGAFVFNYGNELQQSPPTASFTFDFEENGDYTVTATHNGGESFTTTNTGELRLVSSDSGESDFSLPTSAGDSESVTDVGAGENVRVIWESPDGSQSSIVAQTTTPPSS